MTPQYGDDQNDDSLNFAEVDPGAAVDFAQEEDMVAPASAFHRKLSTYRARREKGISQDDQVAPSEAAIEPDTDPDETFPARVISRIAKADDASPAPSSAEPWDFSRLAAFWQHCGFQCIVADGMVRLTVPAGSGNEGPAEVIDTGGRLDVTGPLSNELAVALIMRVREEWDGHAELDGSWTEEECRLLRDAAARLGVQIVSNAAKAAEVEQPAPIPVP